VGTNPQSPIPNPSASRTPVWRWEPKEIVQHLAGLLDAKVKITLEIEADMPSGAPENVVRTVTENCRTLKFNSQGYEEV
jgi:hypothetical protein